MVYPFISDEVDNMFTLYLGGNPLDPSTHHLKMKVLSACIVSGSSGVPRTHLIINTSFFQYSLYGALNCMLINATTVWMSILAHFVTNSPLKQICDKS